MRPRRYAADNLATYVGSMQGYFCFNEAAALRRG